MPFSFAIGLRRLRIRMDRKRYQTQPKCLLLLDIRHRLCSRELTLHRVVTGTMIRTYVRRVEFNTAATESSSVFRSRTMNCLAGLKQEHRMLIFDRDNWPKHRAWAVFTAATTVAATFWYSFHGFSSGAWHWPSGSSPPGLTFGVAGGLIIIFEMLLWPRKSLWRGLRLGRTKTWMMAHIWLGLLTLPLLLLHGRFHFGLGTSTLSAVLMWLLAGVIVSGVWGLFVQNMLPRIMLEQLPAETIHSQIKHILDQYGDEAAQLARSTCGRPADGAATAAGEADEEKAPSYLVVGTVRKVGRVQGKVVQAGVEAVWVPESDALRAFHLRHVDPYLRADSGRKSSLSSMARAAELFQELKTHLRPEAHAVVDRLATLCDQRRQFDLQMRLHRWLHLWLSVHVPLSVALLGLMAAHVFLAFKFM